MGNSLSSILHRPGSYPTTLYIMHKHTHILVLERTLQLATSVITTRGAAVTGYKL